MNFNFIALKGSESSGDDDSDDDDSFVPSATTPDQVKSLICLMLSHLHIFNEITFNLQPKFYWLYYYHLCE